MLLVEFCCTVLLERLFTVKAFVLSTASVLANMESTDETIDVWNGNRSVHISGLG